MKQLKAGCWKIIKDNATSRTHTPVPSEGEPMDIDGIQSISPATIKFNEVLGKVPRVVSQKCAESMSRSLVFYSILHLCNEKGVDIEMQADLEDLTIISPPEVSQTE